MPRTSAPRRLYPDDAKLELGQFFCKHCDSVFASKYTFNRHISMSLQSFTEHKGDDISIQVISDQFKRWSALNEQLPTFCSTCFTEFRNRMSKFRHVCVQKVDQECKKRIENLQKEEKYALNLLNGKISDRVFSKHVTFGDVFYHYGHEIFHEAIKKQSLCVIVDSVFKNPKHDSLHVVRFEKEDGTFLVCEYESWKPMNANLVVNTLFDNALLLLRQTYVGVTRARLMQFLTANNIRLRTEFWLEDLEGGSPELIKREKEQILKLFTSQ